MCLPLLVLRPDLQHSRKMVEEFFKNPKLDEVIEGDIFMRFDL
jgi:hypothetical protein